MTKLTYEDQAFVDNFDKQFKSIIDTLEKAKQFKLDDYLVLYVSDSKGVMRKIQGSLRQLQRDPIHQAGEQEG